VASSRSLRPKCRAQRAASGVKPSKPSRAKALKEASSVAGSMRAKVGVGREVVGETGLGGIEFDPGRCGQRDAVDFFAGALGDGIEGADFLEFVAEEVEAVRLRGGDGINVNDAATDGIVAGDPQTASES